MTFLEKLTKLNEERYVSNEETYYLALREIKRALEEDAMPGQEIDDIVELIDHVLPTGDWRARVKFGKI